MIELLLIAYLAIGAVIGLFSLCVDHNAPEDMPGVAAWYIGHVIAWPLLRFYLFALDRGRFG